MNNQRPAWAPMQTPAVQPQAPAAPQTQPQYVQPPAPQTQPQYVQPPQGFQGQPPQTPQGGGALAALQGINNAQATARGEYFDATPPQPNNSAEGAGSYLCKINDVFDKVTFRSGPSIIVNLEIVQSSQERLPPGSTRSYVQALRDQRVAFTNLISFLGAAYGFDAKISEQLATINGEIARQSEALLSKACREKTLNGYFIGVKTRLHETKEKKLITVMDFFPAPKAG